MLTQQSADAQEPAYRPLHGLNEIESALVYACRVQDTQAIERLVRAGAYPNGNHFLYEMSMLISAANGETGSVLALLDAGVFLDNVEEEISPLEQACKSNRIETARALLDRGAAVTRTNGRRMGGALFHAVTFAASNDLIDLLLERGASIDEAREGDRMTPLMVAAIMGLTRVMSHLLDRCADRHLKDDRGSTAADLAVKHSAPAAAALLAAWEARQAANETLASIAAPGAVP